MSKGYIIKHTSRIEVESYLMNVTKSGYVGYCMDPGRAKVFGSRKEAWEAAENMPSNGIIELEEVEVDENRGVKARTGCAERSD